MSPIAETDQSNLYIYEESDWAENPPAPTPTLETLRVTRESLQQRTTAQVIEEISSGGNVEDLRRTDRESQGDLNGFLYYPAGTGALARILEGTFRSSWGAVKTITATDISFDGANSIDSVGGDLSIFKLGDVIRVAGGDNDGKFYEASADGTTNSVAIVEAGITESAGTSITLDNDGFLENGVLTKSYGIEKTLENIAVPAFLQYIGKQFGGFTMQMQPGQAITWVANTMGQQELVDTATIGDGTPNAKDAGAVMVASEDVDLIEEGGAASTLLWENITIAIDNQLRARKGIGNLGPAREFGKGKFVVTGQMEALLEDTALITKYHGFTASSFRFRTFRGSDSLYWNIPNMYFEDCRQIAEGPNNDYRVRIQYRAIIDSALGSTLRIDRHAAT